MPTKKSERWYADWIVTADVCTDLPGSLQDSKDEVLRRLDNLLRQQGTSIYLPCNLALLSVLRSRGKSDIKPGYLTCISRLHARMCIRCVNHLEKSKPFVFNQFNIAHLVFISILH